MFQFFGKFLSLIKAFDVFYKMRYILWVVALLEAFDVIQDGGAILDFSQN